MSAACDFEWCEADGFDEHHYNGVHLATSGNACDCTVCALGEGVTPNTVSTGVTVPEDGTEPWISLWLEGEHYDTDAYMTVAEAIEFREHLSLAISRAKEAVAHA